jgi:hypothetical protein
MLQIASLVDAFVQRVNSRPRQHESMEKVPEFLREESTESSADGPIEGWTSWRIVRRNNAACVDELEKQVGRPFPPSFQYFLANYSFPAFECESVMFFANTGERTFWELGQRLFCDPGMSPQLLKAGFLQIGNPFFYNYDPVCFDCSGSTIEKRMVQLDHEAMLIHGQVKIVKETARSFADLIRAELELR